MFHVWILTNDYSEYLMKILKDVGFKEEWNDNLNYLVIDKSSNTYENARSSLSLLIF